MNRPPSGYYRNLLSNKFPDVRIAFTSQPIVGCTKVDSQPIIKELESSKDEFAPFYAEGLKNGTLAAIVENSQIDRYFGTGELYFRT